MDLVHTFESGHSLHIYLDGGMHGKLFASFSAMNNGVPTAMTTSPEVRDLHQRAVAALGTNGFTKAIGTAVHITTDNVLWEQAVLQHKDHPPSSIESAAAALLKTPALGFKDSLAEQFKKAPVLEKLKAFLDKNLTKDQLNIDWFMEKLVKEIPELAEINQSVGRVA